MNNRFFVLSLKIIYIFLFFLFLYAPIINLLGCAFKSGLGGLKELFDGSQNHLIEGFFNSLLTAVSSWAIAITISLLTLFFISITKINFFADIALINLIIPETILAITLLLLFAHLGITLGFKTVILTHSVLSLGYLFSFLYYRFIHLDTYVLEASRDLGATVFIQWKTVIFSLLKPSMVMGSALAMILSFDDFIFSYFCSNPDFQTLPLVFLSILWTEPSPAFYAFSALLLTTCFVAGLCGFALFIYKNNKSKSYEG
jgi:spermidine/putrescine transport system permease protein